jgi:hypothetical protein
MWMAARSYAEYRSFVPNAFERERSREYLMWVMSYVIEHAATEEREGKWIVKRRLTSYITIAKAYTSVSFVRRAVFKPNFSGKSNSGASHRTDHVSHSEMETPVFTSESRRKEAILKFVRTARWSLFTRMLDWRTYQSLSERYEVNNLRP